MPRILVAVLCLLLLSLQQEGPRHGIDHLRAQLAQAHERALQAPSEACNECALLAGASHAVAGTPMVTVVAAVGVPAPHSRAFPFSPQAARYYAARGPPPQA